jgi:ppGpp synthetase/RelA/SpoT-type nucleotidyltranferase
MPDENVAAAFDFQAHERAAVSDYLKVQGYYADFSGVVARIIEECLKKRRIKVHSVQFRAKDPASFGRKAAIPSEADPQKPKYPYPLKQVTDLAGIRVIAHFPNTLREIDELLIAEFEVVERSDKGEELIEEERFGYSSIHYLVRLNPERSALAEYERFQSAIAEVQVRTILQHAWAEIEHDIQYKSALAIPTEIRRRFMSLAGLLEIADREFQAIQDTDRQQTSEARNLVTRGELGTVEITPDALKAFLDKKLGPDGRISDWTYDWTARLLKRLGYRTLDQVETSIAPYDDDRLSEIAEGGRQGQTTRFEYMLLAAMGERYIRRHSFHGQPWFEDRERDRLRRFRDAGIQLGDYDPLSPAEPPDGHAQVPPERVIQGIAYSARGDV